MNLVDTVAPGCVRQRTDARSMPAQASSSHGSFDFDQPVSCSWLAQFESYGLLPDMTFSSNTRNKRRIAFVALLVWLFGVASGVANACLLELRTAPSAGTTSATLERAHVRHAATGHAAGSDAHQHDDANAPKAPCLKACDDSGNSIPKQPGAAAGTDPGPPFMVAILWTTAPSSLSATQRQDAWSGTPSEPPLRLRYVRLTL